VVTTRVLGYEVGSLIPGTCKLREIPLSFFWRRVLDLGLLLGLGLVRKIKKKEENDMMGLGLKQKKIRIR